MAPAVQLQKRKPSARTAGRKTEAIAQFTKCQMRYVLFGLLLCCYTSAKGQEYLNWSSYTIKHFYNKVDLDEALDESGDAISYVFVQTKSPSIGAYEIEISDAEGSLYKVKGTDYYIKFNSYFGYAGYSQEGVLVVEYYYGYYSSTFYRKP